MGGIHDAEWLRLPESEIDLEDLPEYFSRNGAIVTPGLRSRVTSRCIAEYEELYNRKCPDGLQGVEDRATLEEMKRDGTPERYWPDEPDYDEWKRAQEEFFGIVRVLETYDFKSGEYSCRTAPGMFRNGFVNSGFRMSVPEYAKWVDQGGMGGPGTLLPGEGFPGEREAIEHMGDHDDKWLKRPEADIDLGDLPEYWSRNGIRITRALCDRVTRRCIEEYGDMFQRLYPDEGALEGARDHREYILSERERMREAGEPEESLPDVPEEPDEELQNQRWHQAEESFFRKVHKLSTWKFRTDGEWPCKCDFDVPGDGVITPEFFVQVRDYGHWAVRHALDSVMPESAKASLEAKGGLPPAPGRFAEAVAAGVAQMEESPAGDTAGNARKNSDPGDFGE